MKIFFGVMTTLSTATLLLAACGGAGGAAEPAEGAAAAGGEPALVVTDQAEWDSLAASGQASFDRACGACHPGGDADLGPALKGHMIPMTTMTTQIREGSGRMKPIDATKLPEEEMRGLMVYLATIGAVGDVKGP
jgi:mono/diheme cytochrome c family protein